MIIAAVLSVTVTGCADRQPTAPILQRVSHNSSTSFNKFFTAWSQGYSSGPIQTQQFALDTRQDRQYVDWWVDAKVKAFAQANPGRLYIHGDEPDQWCVTPEDYAQQYHDFVETLRGADPSARVSPAGFAEPNYKCCPGPDDVPNACWSSNHSIGYADQFYNAYVRRFGKAPPVNEWRFHDFGLAYGPGDIDGWWSRVDREAAWSVSHGANMILGSWGFHGWRESPAEYQEHLKQALGRLMNDSRINGAAYWSHEPWENSVWFLVDGAGNLTSAGQTFVNPLTDTPTDLKIGGSSNGHAQLRWNNTTAAWAAEVEFWVQAPGASSFVLRSTERVGQPGAAESSFAAFNSGDNVKARVRYYNPYGVAAWSSFSDAIVVGSGDTGAFQGTITRRNPILCILQLC
jgi:hypothetical protein